MLSAEQKENLFKEPEEESLVCICYKCFDKLKLKHGNGRVWASKLGKKDGKYDCCSICGKCSGTIISTYV